MSANCIAFDGAGDSHASSNGHFAEGFMMPLHGSDGPLARLVFAAALIAGYVCLAVAFDALLFSSPF